DAAQPWSSRRCGGPAAGAELRSRRAPCLPVKIAGARGRRNGMASNARSSAMVGFALAIAVALLLVVVLRAGADRSTRQPPPPPALVAQAAATPAVDAVDSDAPAPRVE